MIILQEDLEKEVGVQALIELTDLNNDGALNSSVFDDAVSDSLSFIESFFDLPALPSNLLQKISIDFTLYNLREKHGLNDDDTKEQRKTNERYLKDMSRGTMRKSTAETNESIAVKTTASFRHSTKKMNLGGFND